MVWERKRERKRGKNRSSGGGDGGVSGLFAVVLAGYQTAMRCLDSLLYDTPGSFLSFLLINIKKIGELTLPEIPHTNAWYCICMCMLVGFCLVPNVCKDRKTWHYRHCMDQPPVPARKTSKYKTNASKNDKKYFH